MKYNKSNINWKYSLYGAFIGVILSLALVYIIKVESVIY